MRTGNLRSAIPRKCLAMTSASPTTRTIHKQPMTSSILDTYFSWTNHWFDGTRQIIRSSSPIRISFPSRSTPHPPRYSTWARVVPSAIERTNRSSEATKTVARPAQVKTTKVPSMCLARMGICSIPTVPPIKDKAPCSQLLSRMKSFSNSSRPTIGCSRKDARTVPAEG